MDTRTDSGQFYPGGKVLPRQPGSGGGGGTVVLDDTVTEGSQNGVKSSGIWTWVKSLLPNWLTSNYAEPATAASVNAKYTLPAGGIPTTDLAENVRESLGKADSALQTLPEHEHPQSQVTGLEDALAAKRDKTNRQWFGTPVMTGGAVFDGISYLEDILLWVANFHTASGSYYCYIGFEKPADDWTVIGPIPEGNVNTESGDAWAGGDVTITREVTNLALDSDVAANYVAKEQGKGLSTNDYTNAAAAKVALVDYKANEFTPFVLYGSDYQTGDEIYFDPYNSIWILFRGGTTAIKEGDEQDLYVDFRPSYDVQAARTRVLRTGDAATPQDVSNAVAAKRDKTDHVVVPEHWGDFAVRSGDVEPALDGVTPTVAWGEFDGVAGWTITGLANGFEQCLKCPSPSDATHLAFMVWNDVEGSPYWGDSGIIECDLLSERRYLISGLSSSGEPLDPNVAELFSKSNTSLVQAVDAKAATSAANIPDRGVAVVDGSSGTAASKQTVTVSFAAAKGTELRMCELLITDVAEDDAVTVSLPAGTYQFADGADATKKADGNHFIFTEYERGKWFVNLVSTTAEEVA